MEHQEMVLEQLDQWGIPYEIHTHPPAHTITECLAMDFITQDIVICKNIFLCNRQKTNFYLMLIHPQKAFHTGVVSKALGVSRLSFGPDELLPEMLGLVSGAVSPLGLMFDKEKKIALVGDEDLLSYKRIAFHPCVNTSTVVFQAADFWQKLLIKMDRTPMFIKAE